MPRHKKATCIVSNTDPFAAAREVMTSIDRLLAFAGKPVPTDDPLRLKVRRRLLEIGPVGRCETCGRAYIMTRVDRCHGLLMPVQGAFSQPVITIPDGEPELPDWCRDAEFNLVSLVRSGARYLHGCKVCHALFLTRDKRQINCGSVDCQRTATRQRAKVARSVVRARAIRKKAAAEQHRIERNLAEAERRVGAFGARERRNAK